LLQFLNLSAQFGDLGRIDRRGLRCALEQSHT
jgi:hypothetical protein